MRESASCARIADDPLLNGRTMLGGPTALGVDTVATADRDLLIGELAALVVLIGLLLWGFRGWAAAGLSVLGGLFTVCAGMGGPALLSFARPVSGVALNLLAGLGLGLSVDFGLLIATRFRGEVAAGRGITPAVDAAVRTAGRTVLFSAATVTAAMSATLVYPEPFISALGYAGMLAAGLAAAVLPTGMESVRAHHAVEAGFPAFATEPAVVIVHGGPEQKAEAESVAASIVGVQGVKAIPPPLWTDGLGWRVDTSLTGPSPGDGARETVKTIRGPPTPVPISVAGSTAAFLDSEASLTRHLPLKAVVLNLFTGAATAGLLVAAHSGPTKRMEGGLDVQIVVLLARVCELRRSGLSTSEAACLATDRTGRTISAGAAIICVTFAGMSFGDVVAIRQLGMGLIIAVVLDVTVVRAILVPGC